MPQYRFKCKKCKFSFDEIVKNEQSVVKCPKCGGLVKRIITSANFIINGFSAENGYSKPKEK